MERDYRHQAEGTRKEAWVEAWSERIGNLRMRCSRCLYDDSVPDITFDRDGVCNYCATHDRLNREYPAGDAGYARLKKIASQIRRENARKEFDVIVGVSGGCDSSYLVYLAKDLGLRPLAVHFDNTWNSTIAVENISNVLKKLDVPLYTYVVNNEEYDDLYRSFLRAGVPDIDVPTDIALATTLFRAAEKYRIRYLFEGHSFRTEGLAPLGWVYMDAQYIESVHRQFGTMKLETFPNLWLHLQLKWMIFNRIKKVRPLWYIEYNKEQAKRFLTDTFSWQWYGGHHLENRFTQFAITYFYPRRFGIDMRLLGYSALIRSGQLSRDEGIRFVTEPPAFDPGIVAMLKKRLGFDDDEFERCMTMPKRSFRDFRTYKQLFERMRPFFWLMAKMDLIPMSFYIKYTSKKDI